MKHLLILLITLTFAGNARAKEQDSKADSIKRLIATDLKSPKTTAKPNVDRLNELAEEYYESYPDSTFKYASMAMAFGSRSGYVKGVADGLNNVGMVNTFRGEYALSTRNFSRALQLHRSVGDRYGMSDDQIGLGRVQDFLGNYPKAIIYLDSALAIRKTLGNEADLADCYNYLGITYDNKGEFSKALDYYLKSLAIYLKHKNELATADSYCNIGIIMQHLELYPKALNYFNTALKIWLKYKDMQGISTIYLNNGEVYMAQRKFAEAFTSLNKASKIFHDMDDREGISLAYYDLGLCYHHTDRRDSALKYLNLSLATAAADKIPYNKTHAYLGLATVYNSTRDHTNALAYASLAKNTADGLGNADLRADAALQLSQALAASGKFEQAYREQRLYSTLQDSVNHTEILQRLAAYDLESAFAKDQLAYKRQNEAQIKAYQQAIRDQRNMIIFYAVVALLTAAIALVYYKGKRKQTLINRELTQKNTEIIAQKNSLDEHSHKLNDLNHLKDRLIAVLAHDLRAPLSTLRGLFGLMADQDLTPEEFAEMAPKVFSRLENTSDFLDTLLFWINSQVDGTNNVTSFSLYDMVENELSILEVQLQQKQLTVINTVGKDDYVIADPNSIRIVVHNFLTNAIKFSPVGGEVGISAYNGVDGKQIFKISDRGVGILPHQLSALFKSKVNSTPGTNNELGTGMGLLFCKDLIENSNGKIWAESEPGKGADLYFSLPVGDATSR
ncbi:tetratricopeptide repeat-containing sensor histidine kinase [Mucilaginibacter myungsuensis]|uniref:histidine kinase n=1 Tax=Mucilaginibacter myungsuensis TaxID=649104 RepID=A0A929KZP0_9SPHI|nr:tetratricopeptide repeat-containing sensor histidine kinase [Mucilaginibacter myungsuensis]MBE9664152.1 tetratricopeptide repeat-containing sensor histidine kinase [Mucilaginibacter myungsuensis]MDN3599855.1 tetratricopeptide repeat-containing sensor histidine kinase [Mucilaginibacter myungsuensis]